MSLEIWLEGADVSAGFDKVFTIALQNGSVVTFGASGDPLTYTIVDFFGVTTSGSVSLGDGPTIEIFHGVVPTDNGGFRIVFGSGFPSAGALYQVELDSNFALVGSVEQIADSYSGSADIELLPDGGMAVLYNQRDEFGVRDIGLQIFGADGTAGIRELANSNASANILHPRIAINDEVIFTVWFDRDTGASRGRIFNLAGTAQGTAFDISTSLAGEERNFITYVEALSNGTFIAVFVNRDLNFETGNTFARLFDSSGVPLGDDIAIVPPSEAAQFPTGVRALDDGGFLLAWAESGQDGTQQRLIAQYDSDAQSVTDPFELPGFDGSVVSISVLPDGRFVVSDTGLDPSFVIVDGRMGNFDGDEGDNLLVGSATSASTVNGFGGNDQFFGTDQNDTFFGGDGDDILNGGGGDDILDGGAGDDTIFGGAGNDLITTGDGNDIVDAGAGDDVVTAQISDIARFDPSLRVVLNVDGGLGQDSLVFTPGALFFAVYDAADVSGFEALLIDSTDDFVNPTLVSLTGLQEISILGGQGGLSLSDSDNRNAEVTISTPVGSNFRGSLSLANSSVASVTGSEGFDTIVVREGAFAGDVNLGGGNDAFVIEAGSSLNTAVASLDGGAGDEDELTYIFPETPISDSLANVTGVEQLQLTGPNSSEPHSYTFSDISGFDFIFASSTIFGGNVNGANVILLPGSGSDLSGTILSGAAGGSFTISNGLTVGSYIYYGPEGERPEDDPDRFAEVGVSIINQGTILNEVDFGNGDDIYDGRDGTVAGPVTGGAGNDILLGGTVAETFFGGLDADTLNGGGGDDLLDGGSNVDTAVFGGDFADYTITQTSTGVFEVVGADGTDTLTTIEFARFDDQTVRLLNGEGISVNFETSDPSVYQQALSGLRDFGGNDLGGDGAWLRIGAADVNGDGDVDQILVNDAIGRFATVGTAPDGLVYFDDHSWAGETRVAGIYIDPFVANGSVEQGGPFDSQARFQNDLRIENINRVLGSDDYNNDGVWEVYLALTDGTAYLQALMHADGNIRFANYQSEEQVREYLTANGFGEETFGDWFPNDQNAQSAQGTSNEVKPQSELSAPFAPPSDPFAIDDVTLEATSLWQGQYREFPTEFFG